MFGHVELFGDVAGFAGADVFAGAVDDDAIFFFQEFVEGFPEVVFKGELDPGVEIAVEEYDRAFSDAFDLGESGQGCSFLYIEKCGQFGVCFYRGAFYAEVDYVDASAFHFFCKAMPVAEGGRHHLCRGDLGAEAFFSDEKAFVFQFVGGLADGVAGDAESVGEFDLRGEVFAVLVFG